MFILFDDLTVLFDDLIVVFDAITIEYEVNTGSGLNKKRKRRKEYEFNKKAKLIAAKKFVLDDYIGVIGYCLFKLNKIYNILYKNIQLFVQNNTISINKKSRVYNNLNLNFSKFYNINNNVLLNSNKLLILNIEKNINILKQKQLNKYNIVDICVGTLNKVIDKNYNIISKISKNMSKEMVISCQKDMFKIYNALNII